MSLKVKPCIKEDIPILADIYFLSFQNALRIAAFPDTPAVRKWQIEQYQKTFGDPEALFLKTVDEQQNILAFAECFRPKKEGSRTDEEPEWPEWPAEGNHAVADAFFPRFVEKHEALLGNRPHWYMQILATHPKHVGKGAGSLLIRHILELADQDGHESYLESTPNAVPVYEKYGFKGVETLSGMIDGEEYKILCMIRPPKE